MQQKLPDPTKSTGGAPYPHPQHTQITANLWIPLTKFSVFSQLIYLCQERSQLTDILGCILYKNYVIHFYQIVLSNIHWLFGNGLIIIFRDIFCLKIFWNGFIVWFYMPKKQSNFLKSCITLIMKLHNLSHLRIIDKNEPQVFLSVCHLQFLFYSNACLKALL